MPPAKKSPDPKPSPQQSKAPPASGNGEVALPLKGPAAEQMRKPTARLGDQAQGSNRGGKKGQDSNRGGKPGKKDAPVKGAPAEKKKGGKLGTVDEEPASSAPALPVIKSSASQGADGKKKIEYLTEELMARKPLEPKLREALLKKCGPAVQEVNFVRNESKPPVGRADDLAPSRHERVPPCRIVLMFNWSAIA